MREEACTLGGGRPSGTFSRNANGFVVPTTAHPSVVVPSEDVASSAEAGPDDGRPALEESCTLGGGRVSGTPVGYRGGSAADQ